MITNTKALKDICGLPAIVHCYRRTKLSKKVDEVFVCTDSNEIRHSVESHGGKVIMTSDHINGSERIYEASQQLQNCDYIINVQGDEVLVNPEHIDTVISTLTSDKDINYVLGVTDFTQSGQKAVFKAVLDHANDLIYCSREDTVFLSIQILENWLELLHILNIRKVNLHSDQVVENWLERPESLQGDIVLIENSLESDR